MHAWDCIKTTFKKREGPNRKYILIFMLMMAMNIMPFIGESSIAYNYVRTRYEWEVDEYSTYSSIVSASSLVGKQEKDFNCFSTSELKVMNSFFFASRSGHFHSPYLSAGHLRVTRYDSPVFEHYREAFD